jgi:hypothetical protein
MRGLLPFLITGKEAPKRLRRLLRYFFLKINSNTSFGSAKSAMKIRAISYRIETNMGNLSLIIIFILTRTPSFLIHILKT